MTTTKTAAENLNDAATALAALESQSRDRNGPEAAAADHGLHEIADTLYESGRLDEVIEHARKGR